MLGRDGTELLYFPMLGYSHGDFEAMREMLDRDDTVLGLGDGGAHCGILCDASLPTYMLTHWTRDRSRGPTLPLEDIVRRQTAHTAQVYGLADRGLLREGLKADVNIIDYERLAFEAPYMAYDLPAGGKRLLQKARGYRATLVAGQPVFIDGEATGALPGALVRGR
jgi:N-acyl-D-aspartate/D-glutamate deacylase